VVGRGAGPCRTVPGTVGGDPFRSALGYGVPVSRGSRTDRTLARRAAVLGLVVLASVGTACGSPSLSDASTAASTAAASGAGAHSLVGLRYCEVLLVHASPAGPVADVYNSFPLNTCPAAKWNALDAKAIAADDGALAALLNGPRFWLMDSIAKVGGTPKTIKTFGGIAMYLDATVSLGNLVGSGSLATAARSQLYTPHAVDRQTTFTYDAGRQVYELWAADGAHYVMQTWSRQEDPTLRQRDLAGLGSRLHLPAGWSYHVRTLTAPLRVVTTTTAGEVLQDDLLNSYSRETPG